MVGTNKNTSGVWDGRLKKGDLRIGRHPRVDLHCSSDLMGCGLVWGWVLIMLSKRTQRGRRGPPRRLKRGEKQARIA
eukprot:368409-Pyramimonas_sp.AAC.1